MNVAAFAGEAPATTLTLAFTLEKPFLTPQVAQRSDIG